MGANENISDDILEGSVDVDTEKPKHVLVVDDSSVARNQVKRVLQKVGIECTLANDGQAGLEVLQSWVENGENIDDKIALVISDIEMPRMDGYTLTTKIRKDPRLQGLYVMLHTSLSGVFNNSMVEKVGANHFIPKFKPNELANTVMNLVNNRDPSEGMDNISDE